MPIKSSSKSLLAARKAGLHFLRAEISVGLTYAAMTQAKNGVEGVRTRTRARAAYDAVLRFSDRATLTEVEQEEVLAALNKLKQRLQALGERF